MTELAEKIVQIAISQLGVKEATGHNDGIPAKRYAAGRQESWCADFVVWVWAAAGRPLEGNKHKLPSVAYMMQEQIRVDAFWASCGPVDSVAFPRPADIVFFDWRIDSDAGKGLHVELIERVEIDVAAVGGLWLHTIGGNVGDAVMRRRRNLHNVLGFARPKET